MTAHSFPALLADTPGAPPAKLAALFLRSHGRRDREWLLERLGPAARAQLMPLIAELETLGIAGPAARAGIEPSVVAHAHSREPASPPSPATLAVGIMRAPMRDVVRALRHEPEALIQRVLRHTDASWARGLAEALAASGHRRLVVPATLHGGPTAPAPGTLDHAVLETLATRLAGAAGERRPTPASVLATWLRGLRRRAMGDLSPGGATTP